MIREYTRAITIAIVSILIVVVFAKGCSYGESRKEQEIAQLTAQVSELLAETAGYRRAEEARAKEIERAVAEAEATKQRVSEAAKEVENLRKALAQTEREAKLAQAHRDPSCSELLERKVCDIVPLP